MGFTFSTAPTPIVFPSSRILNRPSCGKTSKGSTHTGCAVINRATHFIPRLTNLGFRRFTFSRSSKSSTNNSSTKICTPRRASCSTCTDAPPWRHHRRDDIISTLPRGVIIVRMISSRRSPAASSCSSTKGCEFGDFYNRTWVRFEAFAKCSPSMRCSQRPRTTYRRARS